MALPPVRSNNIVGIYEDLINQGRIIDLEKQDRAKAISAIETLLSDFMK